jgi:hypothetical protein
MSAIITASIRVDKLPKEKFIKGKDGAVYYNFTLSINDETRYGNNVWVTDSQTKEEREAKIQKLSLGNGKVVWTDNSIVIAEREDNNNINNNNDNDADLPF